MSSCPAIIANHFNTPNSTSSDSSSSPPVTQADKTLSQAIINTLNSLRRAMQDNTDDCKHDYLTALSQIKTHNNKNRFRKALDSLLGKTPVEEAQLVGVGIYMQHVSSYLESASEVTDDTLLRLLAQNQKIQSILVAEKQKAIEDAKKQCQLENDVEIAALKERIHQLEKSPPMTLAHPQPPKPAATINFPTRPIEKKDACDHLDNHALHQTENIRLKSEILRLQKLWEVNEVNIDRKENEHRMASGGLQLQIQKLRDQCLFIGEEKERSQADLKQANSHVEKLQKQMLEQKKELHRYNEVTRQLEGLLQTSRDYAYVKSLVDLLDTLKKDSEAKEFILTSELQKRIAENNEQFKDSQSRLASIYDVGKESYIQKQEVMIAHHKTELEQQEKKINELEKLLSVQDNAELIKALMGLISDIAEGFRDSETKVLTEESFQSKVSAIMSKFT